MKFLLWFRSITRWLFVLGISLIAVGLLFSKVFISVGSFTILGTWLIDWDMKNKLRQFWSNKVALGISLLFLVHLLGIIYSNDLQYALKDIRIKLPLMLFPLVFSTSTPLRKNEFHLILGLFIGSVFISSLISFYLLYFGGEVYSSDNRNISFFISHIRFALSVCLAFFFSIYLLLRSELKKIRPVIIAIAIWFLIFLILLESLTGLVVIGISTFVMTIRQLRVRKNKRLLIYSLLTLLLIGGLATAYVNSLYNNYLSWQTTKDLPFYERSKGGEAYIHMDYNNPNPHRQNGYMVYKNIAWKELKEAWNKRSNYKFEGDDIKGYPIRHVVLWYLTSKGLNKDAEAIEKLSDEEIRHIEMGISNYKYVDRPGLEVRILETIWEFHNYFEGGDFNGHSIVMRLEFWKTALDIFKNNWLIGVGTGDIANAFKEQYESNHTLLHEEWRLRTHNQFITLAATFGIIGFLLCIYAFMVPFTIRNLPWIYMAFAIIIYVSMLNEDTLETQVGATIYAFFNSLLLFMMPKKED